MDREVEIKMYLERMVKDDTCSIKSLFYSKYD